MEDAICECGLCNHFKRTHKAVVVTGVRQWRGKCKKSGALISSKNCEPCDSFDGNDKWVENQLVAKSW